MIKELMDKHHISPKHSFMVGDKLIDAESGKNSGIEGVLVRSRPTETTEFSFFKTLLDFAHHLQKIAK